jgi:hypothetical protein
MQHWISVQADQESGDWYMIKYCGQTKPEDADHYEVRKVDGDIAEALPVGIQADEVQVALFWME